MELGSRESNGRLDRVAVGSTAMIVGMQSGKNVACFDVDQCADCGRTSIGTSNKNVCLLRRGYRIGVALLPKSAPIRIRSTAQHAASG